MRFKPQKSQILLLIATAACTLFIWGNSCLPAAQSADNSLHVLAWIAPVLETLHVPADTAHTLLRKAAHMTEFGVLGMLWFFLLAGKRPRLLSGRVLAAGSLCLLTALTDETIQLFSPGRGSLVTDVWIDLSGSCLGILAAGLLSHFLRRSKPSPQNSGAPYPES